MSIDGSTFVANSSARSALGVQFYDGGGQSSASVSVTNSSFSGVVQAVSRCNFLE